MLGNSTLEPNSSSCPRSGQVPGAALVEELRSAADMLTVNVVRARCARCGKKAACNTSNREPSPRQTLNLKVF